MSFRDPKHAYSHCQIITDLSCLDISKNHFNVQQNQESQYYSFSFRQINQEFGKDFPHVQQIKSQMKKLIKI